MNQVFRIEINDDRRQSTSPWQSLVAELSQPARHFFSEARLEALVVDPQDGYCVVKLRSVPMTDPSWQNEFVSLMQSQWPWMKRVEICFTPPDTVPGEDAELSASDRIRMHWQQIMGDVTAEIPLCRALIQEGIPRVTGLEGRLTVHVQALNRASLELLGKRGCALAFARSIYEHTGAAAVVLFDAPADEEPQEEDPHQDELRRMVELALAKKEKRERSGDGVLIGDAIDEPVTPMRDIGFEEEEGIVVEGEVFSLDTRELRNNRVMMQMDLTDFSDSVTAKCYVTHENAALLQSRVTRGTWLKIKGNYQYDKYAREHVVSVERMILVKPVRRQDPAKEKRVELHLHTKMSAMDALLNIDDAMALLAEWGHQAVAVTDHGVVQAFPEAYAAGKKHGIKVIYGIEGYLYNERQDKPRTNHVIILVKSQDGLRNLYKLVTLAHMEHFYRVPRIPKGLLQENRQGLIIGSACEAGELMRAIVAGEPKESLLEIASFYDYLEIQPLANNAFMVDHGIVPDEDALRNLNRKVLELGRELNKPVVATGDVHFLNPEDEVYRRILLAGKGMKDIERETPLYLRTTEEMLAEFGYLGEETAYEVVVRNPSRIAAEAENVKPAPEGLYPPQIEGAAEEIRSMSWQEAEKRYGSPLPAMIAERLDLELHSIIDNGYAGLYWIAGKLVRRSLDDGYLVGSRGSVGSSLVATMTGITEVNPLPPHWYCPECKWSEFVEDGSAGSGFDLPDRDCPQCGAACRKDGHDIPFAVFMGFEGDKVPDIDLNFSGEYQPRAHKYTEELLGKQNVYRAGTISSIADRTAYGFVKGFAADHEMELRNAEMNRLVKGLTGVKRTTGQHPGGLVVIPDGEDVFQFTPLQHPADDRSAETVTTHFDYHSLDENLVKLDILGHDDPTMLRMLQDLTNIDVRHLPFDDQETMKLFSGLEPLQISPEDAGGEVGTLGIPEFGTRFVRGMLEETRPAAFAELVRISGLSHGTDVWLNNAQALIHSKTADLARVISTRDDIMVYLIYQGMDRSQAFAIMEKVRKGKGLSGEDEQNMRQAGVPDWYIESCSKIKYLFPKAHAVAYVMMAFRIAWFKVHHPKAYYATYFSVRADEFDAAIVEGGKEGLRRRFQELQKLGQQATAKDRGLMTILEVAIEMYARSICFLPVDLNKSSATKFSIEEQGLRLPFVAISGLGKVAALHIDQARSQSPFRSRDDLRSRAKLSKAVLEVLEAHGVLDRLPESDQLALF